MNHINTMYISIRKPKKNGAECNAKSFLGSTASPFSLGNLIVHSPFLTFVLIISYSIYNLLI
jgi:hypothetical protein